MQIDTFIPLFNTERLDETRAFYTTHLGFTPTIEVPGSYLELRNGSAVVAFMKPVPDDEASVPGTGDGLCWCLEVADVDAEWTRLVDAGVPPLSRPADQPWGRAAMVADPNGIALCLMKADPDFDPSATVDRTADAR